MLDNIIDFWEDHRKLCIVVGAVVALVIVLLFVRSSNLKKKAEAEAQQRLLAEQAAQQAALEQDKVVEKEPEDEYQNRLGLDADKWSDERVNVKDKDDDEEETPPPARRTPRYPVEVNIFANTDIPRRGMDGSDFKGYRDKVKLADFGTFWGSDLTADDFLGNTRYYVGVAEEDYNPLNDLESVGWLITNLESLSPNDVIQFTNLHVLGSLSSNHVALLCMYDWYSAFGLTDTLVVFEDTSGTLSTSDFHDGDIFSATVFVHNIKVVDDVAGKRVVVCEYELYGEDLYV